MSERTQFAELVEEAASINALPYTREWYEAHRSNLGEGVCRQLGYYEIPAHELLSVVIPVYNEESTLLEIVDRVCAVPIRKELVLIDDGSSDGTRQKLQDLVDPSNPDARIDDPMNRIKVVFHDTNQGKGAAVRTGFRNVSEDSTIVIVQDADLEYDPSEYPRLLHPIIENKADVVYGSRFLGDQPHRVLYYRHYLGNKFLTTLSNCLTNLNLTDMETCYKVFRKEVIDEIEPKLRQNRFGIEPEITAKIARRRYKVYEMSISYSGRTYEQGKKIGWRDGWKALWCILRYAIAD
jgi:glycosyltransferase involved in cell wall biosynthesis